MKREKFLESTDFQFYIDAVPVRSSVARHSHEFFEIAVVVEGKGIHVYHGEPYAIARGDVYVIEPGVEHAYEVDEQSHLTVYNILFEPVLLRKELIALAEMPSFVNFFYVEPFLRESVHFASRLNLNAEELINIRYILDRLLSEYELKPSGYRFLIKTQLIELLVYLSRSYEQAEQQTPAEMQDDRLIMRKICEFIELHYAKPLSLKQICLMCGMSASSFARKFKDYTGKTLIAYRNDVRIQAAQQLLKETDAKIIEIAHQTGFEDISHFNKLFQKRTGMSPKRYRMIK